MPLTLTTLELDGFRGYTGFRLEKLKQLNLIVGPNAVGKTNIVEGIQLLCAGRSFRKPVWADTVSWGFGKAYLKTRLCDEKRCVEHELFIEDGKRSYLVNGKPRRAQDLYTTCPCVLFYPDDLQMVKASSQRRRDVVDALGSQLSKSYSTLRNDYRQVLRQRNQLLHDELDCGELFESWNEALATQAARFMRARWKLAKRLTDEMRRIHADMVSGEDLDVGYFPSWKRYDEDGRPRECTFAGSDGADIPSADEAYECVLDALHRLHEAERARKTTLVGPHKDEISFFIQGRDARAFASQGQQRTIVLTEKLAEVKIIEDISSNKPVLLLDDVMSELDEAHRSSLTRLFSGSAQTFITTTNLGYFQQETLEGAKVVELAAQRLRA